MPDTTLSTLEQIRIKIRRLTRNPSSQQISDADIDSYVNNFVLYDFPNTVKLDSLTTTLTFYTLPYVDVYSTNTVDPNDPLYNFKNEYVNPIGPAYIMGNKTYLSYSYEEFFDIYPNTQVYEDLTNGDGATVNFSGTLSQFPVLRNNVLISAIDNNDSGLEAHDDGQGNFEGDVVAGGTIDYVTGDYDITFLLAPKNQTAIRAYSVPYTQNTPRTILYYKDEFIVRPVPDRPYKIDILCCARPTELLAANQSPELAQWHQYISYGAAIKILQDRLDNDTVNIIVPEFKRQESLVRKKEISQLSQSRVATIFTSGYKSSLDFNNNG